LDLKLVLAVSPVLEIELAALAVLVHLVSVRQVTTAVAAVI